MCGDSRLSGMSIEQLESAIREMGVEERRRLLLWLDENRYELFVENGQIAESQESELLRRRQEYFSNPEQFVRVANEEQLERFFESIRREVQTRLSPAGAD